MTRDVRRVKKVVDTLVEARTLRAVKFESLLSLTKVKRNDRRRVISYVLLAHPPIVKLFTNVIGSLIYLVSTEL